MFSLGSDQINLLGAGFSFGQKFSGLQVGPDSIREHCLSKIQSRFDFSDFGNFEESPDGDPFLQYSDLFVKVREYLKAEGTHWILGGDHGISFATVPALLDKYPELVVVWVDAHGDINTPESSLTGSLHGMPVAGFMGLMGNNKKCDLPWISKYLPADRFAYIGVRDLDPFEKKIIQDKGIHLYSANDVKSQGMKTVLKDAFGKLDPRGDRPIHLSFDIDSVDPSVVKATGTKVIDGIDVSDVQHLGQFLYATKRLVSAEFVELNPSLAPDSTELHQSLNVFTQLMHELVGSTQVS